MQVGAYVEIAEFLYHRGNQGVNLPGRGQAHGVGEGDHFDSAHFQNVHGGEHFVCVPRVAVGITERHRDVYDKIEAGVVSSVLDFLQLVERFFRRLALVVAEKCWRNGIRKAERGHGLRLDRPLRAFLVDHDGDDLNVIGRVEFFEHRFGVRQLGHGLGRDERHRVNVLEPGADQGFQVVNFQVAGDLALESLPRVARALDEFDGVGHADDYLKSAS